MHPAFFLTASTVLGCLFAFQDWLDSRLFNKHIALSLLLEAWGLQYFLWGALLWLLWWRFRATIQNINRRSLLTVIVPISLVFSIGVEMIWIAFFPRLPLGVRPMPYWQRLYFHLDAELVDNMVIFWSGFFLFRGIGYYQKFREREQTAARLETQLVSAQMRALRMQLNPHFLFNTMNGISSLMRTDVGAADEMLEQLSSLLRITFERGEAQFISLKDEMEFIQLYLAMQHRRSAGLIKQEIHVDPSLYDALVPTMILQPIVENAYAHGLSRLREGLLVLRAQRVGSDLQLSVLNSGIGLAIAPQRNRAGVGLANVRERLAAHYGDDQSFSINEVDGGLVEVILQLPLRLCDSEETNLRDPEETFTR
jgi:two-component system, LytTR family, sensor kinase